MNNLSDEKIQEIINLKLSPVIRDSNKLWNAIYKEGASVYAAGRETEALELYRDDYGTGPIPDHNDLKFYGVLAALINHDDLTMRNVGGIAEWE